MCSFLIFFFQAEDGIRDVLGSRGLGDVYKRQDYSGIKEPERVRKLLQGSANLEFWETYTAKDVTPYLQAADNKLRAIVASETPAEEADNAAT